MRAFHARLRRSLVAVVVGVSVMAGLYTAQVPAGGAARAHAQGLHSLRCTPLGSDAALEAPLYAQQEGASGADDEWWCELPHAGRLPAGYGELIRTVSPLTYPYALYTTYYGPSTAANRHALAQTDVSTLTGVWVTDDWDSTVRGVHNLQYPPAPRGVGVRVAKRVVGTLVAGTGRVSVVWRYPARGVPRYLKGVVTVTVTGNGVPKATLLAVARAVTPD